MTERIDECFAGLKAQRRAGLVTFIMGGDPSMDQSEAILNALPGAGADLIEIGMPFSDPMADGPTIQEAGQRALAGGATLKKILQMTGRFRQTNQTTPLILMGYYNPIYHYGVEAFAKDAATAGVDGVIIVDLPPEEELELTPHLKRHHIAFTRLVAPTSDDHRLQSLLPSAEGFIYYVSVAGITGGKTADLASLKTRVAHLKSKTDLPVAVGFGIKTPEQVKAVGAFADAVVVGSALVEAIKRDPTPEAAISFVSALAGR